MRPVHMEESAAHPAATAPDLLATVREGTPMTTPHLLIPVPIPDRIAALIGSCIPPHILEAEFDAECAAREVRRFRGPRLGIEDQADREQALSELARANKMLSAHHPRLAVHPSSSW